MAVYLPSTNSLILEVAKTGSKWVRAAVACAGIQAEQVGPIDQGGHGTLQVHGRNFPFMACFVREPLSWLRSYWAYRIERGWRPKYMLDAKCEDSCFRSFVRKATTQFPGIVGRFFEEYAGLESNPINFIGHQENLVEELIEALSRTGETFDRDAIRKLSQINATTTRPPFCPGADLLVSIAEFPAIRRYGYLCAECDPIAFQEMVRRYPSHEDRLRRLALATEKQHWQRDDQKEADGHPISSGRRHARIMTNFAIYTQTHLEDLSFAESLFWRAHLSEPLHPRAAGSLAVFLHRARGLYDEAERIYRHAISCAPEHADNLGNYAVFLSTIRKNRKAANEYYQRAIGIEPSHTRNLWNYDTFLQAGNNLRSH